MSHPTDPFTTLELQVPPQCISELDKIGRYPDLEALKLLRGRSGANA